ncbi:hypothetical protein LOD99_1621 [Oopsacas minuta]|uniref:Protein SYS1 homolog n=1 Tax=Oopsacas minuta TaxID=111878 RepID=A0AAV7K3T5_9METZ|nr:hypothetical protein LOD99_1621 [Oopsacas minuta]
MPSVFRSFIWDPVLIIAQITTLQSIYYFSYGLLVYVVDSAWLGDSVTLSYIFNSHHLTTTHWYQIIPILTNSLLLSIAVWKIVQRAKLCIDFAATCHIIHLVVCTCYGGFPIDWLWWVGNLLSFAIMAILGEYLCMKTDLAPVAIHLTREN